MNRPGVIHSVFQALSVVYLQLRRVLCGPCSKPGLQDIVENSFYNVKVFEHPNKSVVTDFCRETWSTSGTCCDGKDAL